MLYAISVCSPSSYYAVRSAKYHVRKAASLLGMRQRVEATQAYREALRVCPGYQAAEQGLKEATAGDE